LNILTLISSTEKWDVVQLYEHPFVPKGKQCPSGGIKLNSGLAAAVTYHLKSSRPKVKALKLLLSFSNFFGSVYNTVKLLPHHFSVRVLVTTTFLLK